jgi:hypothetical protein
MKEIQAKQCQQERFRQSKNDEELTSVSLIEVKLLDMIGDTAERLFILCIHCNTSS